MTATTAQVRYQADLYKAAGTPVAASLIISICDQLDEAKESINALTLALEVERDAANLYAKKVAHWIGKYDALLEQQLATSVPQEWNDKNVIAWCIARGINAAKPVQQCLNCLHYNEPLASQNCASCIHGGNVEDNFVALGKEYE